jgi:hypothetical protein
MAPVSVDPTAFAAIQGTGGTTSSSGSDIIAPARVASNTEQPAIGLPGAMKLGAPVSDVPAPPLPSLVPPARPGAASGRFLDAARVEANGRLASADRIIAAAKADLAKVLRENASALKTTLAAERSVIEARKRIARAGEARARAKNERDAVRAEEAELRAEVDLTRAQAIIDDAAPEAASAKAAKAEAEATLLRAEDGRAAEAKVARGLDRKAKPISVFISRKTQRLYIRQGFEPVLDVAVDIQDPSRSIGTHVFTAMMTKFEPATAVWHVVTVVDNGGSMSDRRRGAKSDSAARSRSASAIAALDRVTIPDAIQRQIAESVRGGASIMISDEGISTETGKGTDFVILAK